MAAFYPALFDVARADQLIYLYQTREMHGLWTLLSKTYALNRATLASDDALLFRPALYALLALQKYLWDRSFILWQATSLGLHVCTVLALFVYLRACCRDLGSGAILFWPFVLALYFATLYAGMEMVAWHHVCGYLAFCLLTIGALLAYQRLVVGGSLLAAISLVGLLGLACFTYELGNVTTLLVATALALAARRHQGAGRMRLLATSLTVALLPIAYASWSIADFASHPAASSGDPPLVPLRLPVGAVVTILTWAASALSPGSVGLVPGGRITAMPFAYAGVSGALGAAMAAIVLGCVTYLAFHARKTPHQRLSAMIAFGSAAAFLAIVVAGREMSRGIIFTLTNNSYYCYVFTMLASIGVFHCCVTTGPSAPSSGQRFACRILATGLLITAVIGASKISIITLTMKIAYSGPANRTIDRIEALKAAHGREEGFSFTLDRSCPAYYQAPWLSDHMAGRRDTYTMFSALFPEEERATGKYQVRCD